MPRVPDFAPTPPSCLSRPGYWGRNHGALGKSHGKAPSQPTRSPFACGHVCLPCPPWAWVGWHPVYAPIGCLPSWAWVPAAVLPSRPCLSFFFPPEYKFISSPVELQSDLGGQRSSFQEVSSPAASTLLPVQLINSGTDFGDAMRLLVEFFTQITYNILQMRCMLCWISYSDFSCQEAFGLLLLLSLALTAPVPAPQNGRQVRMKWTFDSVTSFDMPHLC